MHPTNNKYKKNRYRYYLCEEDSRDRGLWRLDTKTGTVRQRCEEDEGLERRLPATDNWDGGWDESDFETDKELSKKESNAICKSWGHNFK